MTAVSNTSPIINLAAIDQLTLLQQLYGHIIIPQAVYHEIAVTGAGEPGAQEVQRLSWIITHTVADQTLVHSLCVELDRGEAEAIACASELNAELLLVDEERGRAIAQRLGLRVIGLLGVLIEAQHRGLIDAVNPILDALVNRAGFWMTRDLYVRVLQAAGENPSATN
jgi:uncharacterized protein